MATISILPNRPLDDTKRAAIKSFYTPAFGAGTFFIIFLPITLGLSFGGAFFGIVPGLVTGIVITTLLLLNRTRKTKRNIARAEYAYEYGDKHTLRFEGISNNYSLKVNNAPQQVIALTLDGQPFEIRTFSPKVLKTYMLPEQTAFSHPEHPKFIVPSGLFLLTPPTPANTGRIIRNSLLLIVPLGFVFCLTFFINSEMKAHSSTYAQPDALIYKQNGRLTLASVFTHFQANQIKNGTTYGSDSYYAQAIDLETGKKLWKIDLDADNNTGGSTGEARLLGESDRYLFFLRNELFIIDKNTGKVAARNNDLPEIKDKLSKQPLGDYMQDAGYTYSDSLRVLVIKGNDGLFYTIDGNTLHTGTVSISDPESFFKNKFKYGNNYRDQLAALSDDGQHCLALLDAKDTALLAHDADAFQMRAADQSVRRTLYSTPSNTNDSNWTAINPGVFLFGGFLVDPHHRLERIDDTLTKYTAYQHLAARYNDFNAPLRTGDKGFVILHKSTIENDATLLLTGISATGQTRWTFSTGYSSIPLMFHDETNNTLYIGGNNTGDNGDHLMQLTAIDLATGATHTYSLL